MRPIRGIRFLKFAIFALIIIAGFGQAVLQLWNWLMPAIFGLPALTFWQAVGLLALGRIIFGGFGMHRGGQWMHRIAERFEYEKMGPEERERFRQQLRSRCGHGDAPAQV